MKTMLNDDGTVWSRAREHLIEAMLWGTLAGCALLFRCTPAEAGVPCALPFNIQNGQPADATQVMANYNALVSCLGNAAAAGLNSDITTLAGLTTPIAPAFGGTQTFVASTTATGTANAVIVAATVPPWTALTRGYTVVFTASATNTSGVTLQVGASAATPVFRRTTGGAIALAGGEIIAGTLTVATYDGTQFQLLNAVTQVPIGTVLETIASVADPGFVLLLGQCVSNSASFARLWVVMGSPGPGACSAGQFPLPDGRGRVVAMVDSGGSGRITVAGGNFDGTVLYGSGGAQNSTALIAHAHGAFIRDPQHTHSYNGIAGATGLLSGGAAGTTTALTTGSSPTGVHVNSVSGGGAGTDDVTAQAGSGSSYSILPPTLMLNRQIKF